MQGLLHQLRLLLLMVTVLSAAATALAAAEQAEPEDTTGGDLPHSDFTEAQLTNARERLAELFDDKLDANKDGKVTRRELTAWLAAVARQQADSDLDEAWKLYTTAAASATTSSSSNDSSNETQHQQLDWEAYASARAKAAAAKADEDDGGGEADSDQAAHMAGLQEEVRRAIAEASKETGLDKAGIKVSMPPASPPEPPKLKQQRTQQQQDREQQRQLRQELLAVELAKDRRRWDAADVDGDGRLSREEFRDFAFADSRAARMRPVLAREALERMDANGDGRVSLVEFLAEGEAAHGGAEGETATPTTKADDAKNFREVWDANKDGYMDAEEMERMLDYLDSSAATATAKPKGDGEGEKVDDEDAADESHAEEADRLIAGSDTDRDGSLTKAEVLGGLAEFAGSAATHYGNSVGVHDEL